MEDSEFARTVCISTSRRSCTSGVIKGVNMSLDATADGSSWPPSSCQPQLQIPSVAAGASSKRGASWRRPDSRSASEAEWHLRVKFSRSRREILLDKLRCPALTWPVHLALANEVMLGPRPTLWRQLRGEKQQKGGRYNCAEPRNPAKGLR